MHIDHKKYEDGEEEVKSIEESEQISLPLIHDLVIRLPKKRSLLESEDKIAIDYPGQPASWKFHKAKDSGVTPGMMLKRENKDQSEYGMIKYPKNKDQSTILKELLAMQIADILGYQRSNCGLVFIQEKDGTVTPAIFSKFSDITLLAEKIVGNHSHYNESRLKSSGEGLVANSKLKRMGELTAYAWLLGDSDFCHKDGCNLAHLKDDEPLILDKALERNDHFELAEDLTLTSVFSKARAKVGSGLGGNYLRHFSLRNFSLLNDSDFMERLIGFQNFLKKCPDIIKAFQQSQAECRRLAKSTRDPQVRTYLEQYDHEINGYIEKIQAKFAQFKGQFKDYLRFLDEEKNPNGKNILSAIILLQNAAATVSSSFSKEGAPSKQPQREKKPQLEFSDKAVRFKFSKEQIASFDYLIGILKEHKIEFSRPSEKDFSIEVPYRALHRDHDPDLIKRLHQAILLDQCPEMLPVTDFIHSKHYFFRESYLKVSHMRHLNSELRSLLIAELTQYKQARKERKLSNQEAFDWLEHMYQILEKATQEREYKLSEHGELGEIASLKAKIAKQQQLLLIDGYENQEIRQIGDQKAFETLLENAHKRDLNHVVNGFLNFLIKNKAALTRPNPELEALIQNMNQSCDNMSDNEIHQHNFNFLNKMAMFITKHTYLQDTVSSRKFTIPSLLQQIASVQQTLLKDKLANNSTFIELLDSKSKPPKTYEGKQALVAEFFKKAKSLAPTHLLLNNLLYCMSNKLIGESDRARLNEIIQWIMKTPPNPSSKIWQEICAEYRQTIKPEILALNEKYQVHTHLGVNQAKIEEAEKLILGSLSQCNGDDLTSEESESEEKDLITEATRWGYVSNKGQGGFFQAVQDQLHKIKPGLSDEKGEILRQAIVQELIHNYREYAEKPEQGFDRYMEEFKKPDVWTTKHLAEKALARILNKPVVILRSDPEQRPIIFKPKDSFTPESKVDEVIVLGWEEKKGLYRSLQPSTSEEDRRNQSRLVSQIIYGSEDIPALIQPRARALERPSISASIQHTLLPAPAAAAAAAAAAAPPVAAPIERARCR